MDGDQNINITRPVAMVTPMQKQNKAITPFIQSTEDVVILEEIIVID